MIPDIEICTENFQSIGLAKKFGAKRIELCSALELGGLTPSYGLISKCTKNRDNIEVHVMIRHRAGDFFYGQHDISIMKKDIKEAKKAGAQGIVFGCLKKNNEISIRKNRELLKISRELGLESTFHRAFDFVPDQAEAIEKLIDLGFDRILTSGGESKALEGLHKIKELVSLAQGRIQIMAGSGINPGNAKLIASSGVNALHFTSHHQVPTTNLGMGTSFQVDPIKIKEITSQFNL